MEQKPHIVLRTFERLVLFPLKICLLIAGIAFLIERAWVFGAFLLLISFFISMVGASLPHRKTQTIEELRSQDVGERFGDFTREESMGLAKALLITAFLLSLTAAGAAIHRELSWYWIVAYFVAVWVIFPIVSILFALDGLGRSRG